MKLTTHPRIFAALGAVSMMAILVPARTASAEQDPRRAQSAQRTFGHRPAAGPSHRPERPDHRGDDRNHDRDNDRGHDRFGGGDRDRSHHWGGAPSHGPGWGRGHDRHPSHGWFGGHRPASHGRHDVHRPTFPRRRDAPWVARYYPVPHVSRHYGPPHVGYGYFRTNTEAFKWLAFTAITLTILDNLNEDAMRRHEAAQVRACDAPVGERIVWNDGNASGSVITTREGTSTTGRYCREFRHEVRIGGRVEEAFGTACLAPDGTWQIVS